MLSYEKNIILHSGSYFFTYFIYIFKKASFSYLYYDFSRTLSIEIINGYINE